MPDRTRLNTVYQYTLAVAAVAEDFQQRQLGPIHLLKYAYLADVAHAARRSGSIYSGVPWRFYHFGPWNEDAFNEIRPALDAISASECRYTSRFENDFVRYELNEYEAKKIARQSENELPFVICNALSQAVHEHGSDTSDLLRYVYLTPPMLAAKPGALLDFKTAIKPAQETLAQGKSARSNAKEKRRRKAVIDSARAEVRRRLAGSPLQRVEPGPTPRYDAVFYDGTAQLDRLAGTHPSPRSGEVVFDESVWDSSQRRDDPDLP